MRFTRKAKLTCLIGQVNLFADETSLDKEDENEEIIETVRMM